MADASQYQPPQPSPGDDADAARPVGMRDALKRILERKKSTTNPSPLSASRAPATDALAAANYSEPRTAPDAPVRLSDVPVTAANALPDVPALHTYKGDMAHSIEEAQVSLAAIAQAQAERDRVSQAEAPRRSWLRLGSLRAAEIGFGLLFIAAALGVLGWSYLRIKPLPAPPTTTAPYVYVDQKKDLLLHPGDTRQTLMQLATDILAEDQLSVGLVEQLALMVASTSGATAPLSTRSFFATVAPAAPDSLVRSLSPQFLLGIHSFGGNKPFLIFKTESYEQAYAGMLGWEYTMQAELTPLFPKPEIMAPPPEATATTTATSTPAASTTSSQQPPTARIIRTSFTDEILQNHDVRVIRLPAQAGGGAGNIVLLWSFVNRQTLVITTGSDTLAEIISRLQKAPTITVPGN
jgi:hypothetical protein